MVGSFKDPLGSGDYVLPTSEIEKIRTLMERNDEMLVLDAQDEPVSDESKVQIHLLFSIFPNSISLHSHGIEP